MSDPTERSSREIARLKPGLREQQGRILANWAVNVSTMPSYRAAPQMTLDELQRGIPELLGMAINVITSVYLDVVAPPVEEARALAMAHGRKRHREGFEIGAAMSDLQTLRREVWRATFREIEQNPQSVTALQELQGRIGETFDGLVIAAAEGWLESTQNSAASAS